MEFRPQAFAADRFGQYIIMIDVTLDAPAGKCSHATSAGDQLNDGDRQLGRVAAKADMRIRYGFCPVWAVLLQVIWLQDYSFENLTVFSA